MEQISHKYVTVAYELYVDNEQGVHEMVEKAPVEHPYQFISGMGVTLERFEEQILSHSVGETFDFVLTEEEAYGAYEEEHVLELEKEKFSVNGHFDRDMIYPGAVLPLVNTDGNRFQGLVLEVKDQTVVIDLNHPLAGKALHFKGKVVTLRDATNEEIQGFINMLSGEGCGCGCDDCGGDCGCGHHGHGEDHPEGCCGHHHGHHHGHEGGHGDDCGCGHHDHGEDHPEDCCGHHHGHHHGHEGGHGDGCCCGHHGTHEA